MLPPSYSRLENLVITCLSGGGLFLAINSSWHTQAAQNFCPGLLPPLRLIRLSKISSKPTAAWRVAEAMVSGLLDHKTTQISYVAVEKEKLTLQQLHHQRFENLDIRHSTAVLHVYLTILSITCV